MSDFVTCEYGIRLPNGAMLPSTTSTAFGTVTFGPLVFTSRAQAEQVLAGLRESAKQVGVDNLGAAVVWRRATDWTTDATAAAFVSSFEQFLDRAPGDPKSSES